MQQVKPSFAVDIIFKASILVVAPDEVSAKRAVDEALNGPVSLSNTIEEGLIMVGTVATVVSESVDLSVDVTGGPYPKKRSANAHE